MREAVLFLTFRTYGTWLHGDARGSVDSENREFGEPRLQRDDGLRRRRAAAMNHSPFLLETAEKRAVVEGAIRDTCSARGWEIFALNVRTNHVHAVLDADTNKERALATLKAWATRALREAQLAPNDRTVWAHHGSTRVLTTDDAVESAIQYVLFEQGARLD